MQRRQFLKTMGGACVTIPLCAQGLSEVLRPAPGQIPPLERTVLSLCAACPNHCSLKIRTVGGKAVGMGGNPLHPVNRGSICSRGSAALDELYHPDRILRPLKRSGERGTGKFEPISWEEALTAIAADLAAVRANGPEKLAILSRDAHNSLGRLLARFMQTFGSPNDLRLDAGYPTNPAIRLMQGVREAEGYDVENCNYVLCFGADLLGCGPAPVYFNGVFGRFRRSSGKARGRWVQIEPQQSLTGHKADQWVAIKPGTEGALALGMAYVLIKRDLCDAEFIRRQTFGFEDWTDEEGANHQGFKSLVLRDYSVYKVSEITGVPAPAIEQLAYDFATRKPSLAIPGGDFGETTTATYAKMAVHALNALVGSIDRPGGVLIQRPIPYAEFPPVEMDEAASRGLAMPRVDGAGSVFSPIADHSPIRLPENLLLQKPYGLEMLIVMGGNPLYNFPEAPKLQQAFEKLPHLICCTSIMDETSLWADYILPTTCFLEEWGDGATPPGAALSATLALRKPFSQPAGEARSPGDILLALANKLGDSVTQALPWADYQAYLRESLAGIYQSGAGYITTGTFDVSWLAALKNMGWRDPGYESFEQFWEQLETKGGWWDPVYSHGRWQDVFKTPTGKFEFYSQTLRQASRSFSPDILRLDPSADLFCLPHYEEPTLEGEQTEFPYILLVYETQHKRGDLGAALASMQEIPNIPHFGVWETHVEISPDAAKKLKLHDNELVWVESPRGRIKLPLRIYGGASGKAVGIALGGGHTQLGRWARDVGANPNVLRPFLADPLSGSAALVCTRVKIYPA